ncbi:MAG: IS1182 family transposase, partial [Bdellovibrionota bacterium]
YHPDQMILFPPAFKDCLTDGDLVFFIMDVVEQLNLDPIYQSYHGDQGGKPAYHPTMMTSLLFYSYCMGVFSSRKIEQATYYQVPFRVLTANQQPDHDTIAEFRKRHLTVLSGLFVGVLRMCQKAGLVKLGHVALDGTKIKANASKHKAMSYGRMEKKARELEDEVARLLAEAEAIDTQEDAKYGQGKRGDELPEELRFKESRLKKIKEAMTALEEEAKVEAEKQREENRQKEEELAREGKARGGKKPQEPSDKPDEKSQKNFTDPESRIMKDGATKSFEQCYNCQAVVDEDSQIIVAPQVTQHANDKKEVEPAVTKMKENLDGEKPEKLSADNGYFSEENVAYLEQEGIDAYLATGRQKHDDPAATLSGGPVPENLTVKEKMTHKLRTEKGRETYKKRKQIVEPVFGQIKEVRGFRRFLLRGLAKVSAEWDLICLTHNLLKLFRSGRFPATA